nr:MAG TPA: hypothetical protein [Herelleviridae sp.]
MIELFFLCIRVFTLSRFDFSLDLYYTKGLDQRLMEELCAAN